MLLQAEHAVFVHRTDLGNIVLRDHGFQACPSSPTPASYLLLYKTVSSLCCSTDRKEPPHKHWPENLSSHLSAVEDIRSLSVLIHHQKQSCLYPHSSVPKDSLQVYFFRNHFLRQYRGSLPD